MWDAVGWFIGFLIFLTLIWTLGFYITKDPKWYGDKWDWIVDKAREFWDWLKAKQSER